MLKLKQDVVIILLARQGGRKARPPCGAVSKMCSAQHSSCPFPCIVFLIISSWWRKQYWH